MSKWVVDIHGDIESDYELIKKYKGPKMGHWIISPNDCFAHCSECGLHGDKGIYKHYRWCPNCGAKMSEIPTGSESEEVCL